jgi:hypothetical protein
MQYPIDIAGLTRLQFFLATDCTQLRLLWLWLLLLEVLLDRLLPQVDVLDLLTELFQLLSDVRLGVLSYVRYGVE